MGCEWLGHAALLCRLHIRPLIRGQHGCNEPCIEVASDHLGFFCTNHAANLQRFCFSTTLLAKNV